jgi:hypothetical protein
MDSTALVVDVRGTAAALQCGGMLSDGSGGAPRES